jgi:xanthine dehydrogenase molybdopterin-binding subunit B
MKLVPAAKCNPRLEGQEKVMGRALFPGDLAAPGMLHMKVLLSKRPHAKITGLDISRAGAIPGIHAMLAARDVPTNEYGFAVFDTPVLAFDVVRYVGDWLDLVAIMTLTNSC